MYANKRIYQCKINRKAQCIKNAVGNYKNGQIPNATILYNISQLLGTTVEYLLTGKNSDETITEEEKQIINAYRNATSAEQEIIKKILDIKTEQEKLSNSKIG